MVDGLCDICGKVGRLTSCGLCGKRVCDNCNTIKGICCTCLGGGKVDDGSGISFENLGDLIRK